MLPRAASTSDAAWRMSGLRATAIDCNWASVSGAWPGVEDRFGRGGMTSKSAKRASIALRCSAGVAPGRAGGKRNGGAVLPGIALGISSG